MLDFSYVKLTLVKQPEKSDLLIVLDPVKYDWRSIGEMLKIGYGDIKSEEYSVSHDNKARLSEVLQLWINQRKREVSWNTIITVIKDPPLNNVNVANEICRFLLNEYNSKKQGINLQ